VVNGGKAEQRNKADRNTFINNTQSNPDVEKRVGIKPGYNPRQTGQQSPAGDVLKAAPEE
jgi:hypothetical protein